MNTCCASWFTLGTFDPHCEQKLRLPRSEDCQVLIFSVPARQWNVVSGPATKVANSVP